MIPFASVQLGTAVRQALLANYLPSRHIKIISLYVIS